MDADFNPFLASSDVDPYPLLARLRDQAPVYHHSADGHDVWILSRYDDVIGALDDWRTFSSEGATSADGSRAARRRAQCGRQLLTTDPPLHDALRRAARGRLTPRAVQELEPAIGRILSAQLEERVTSDSRLDVASDLLWPLTLRVVSDLIGIPAADQPLVLGWYQAFEYDDRPDVADEAGARFGDYFEALAAERALHPRDDLLSDMLQQSADGAFTASDAVMVCRDIFEGGVDVPANLMANALLALADRPADRAALADPDADPRFVRLAVEELARYDGPIYQLPRILMRDVELHGAVIPSSARVLLQLAGANRDERRFPDPDRLDLARPPVRNVAFGSGVHFCLGAPLARLEASVALPLILAAARDYEVVGPVRRPRTDSVMRALLSLELDVQGGGSDAALRAGSVR